jgi:pentose-5-phosphate-3-epimerase
MATPSSTRTVFVTDNKSVMSKVEWFKARIETMYTHQERTIPLYADRIAVAELEKMMEISTACNHKPSRSRNSFGYERPPKDWTTIPTLAEEMNMCLNSMIGRRLILRHNLSLAMFMSNFSTLIEVAMRVETRPNVQHIIVCDHVVSNKHLVLIMLVFQLLFKDANKDHSAFLHICVDEAQEQISRRSPIKSKYMILHRDRTWYAALGMAENRHPGASITMMMNSEMTLDGIENLLKDRDVFVCLTTSMSKVQYSSVVLSMIAERDMVQEMIPGSDPDMNLVRISDSIVCHPTGKTRILYRNKREYVSGFISTLTGSIRPMNLSGMCFDCRSIHTIASVLMPVIRPEEYSKYQISDEAWSQSFAATITKDTYEYLTST